MTPDSPKRAVIYSRQSISRDPSDSLSIEFQERECREYIARQGWVLVGSFSDPDKKGWKRNRPAFTAMLSKLAGGGADVVVLYKLSRFARDLMMQETVITEIASAGGDLVSITEPHMNTSPMVRQILGAVNENYRRDQSDWLVSAFRGRARRGLHHGYAPYGYRLEDSRLAIDDDTSVIAREIWGWALAGLGSSEIMFRLNTRGTPSPRDGSWHQKGLLEILRNPTYAGDVHLNGEVIVRDAHPGLVSREQFDLVQDVLTRRRLIRRKDVASWADGFVDHVCGRRMYLIGWHTSPTSGLRCRFKCRGHFDRKLHPDRACYILPGSVLAETVEATFVELLTSRMAHMIPPEMVAARMEAAHALSAKERTRQRERAIKRLETLKRQRDRLLDMALDGRVDDEMYTSRDATFRAEIETLTIELQHIPGPVLLPDVQLRHGELRSLTHQVLRLAATDPDRLIPLLHALDVRLVLGDETPRLTMGSETGPYFVV